MAVMSSRVFVCCMIAAPMFDDVKHWCLRGGHTTQLYCDDLLQAEGALTAQKRAEADAAAAAKAHESTLASEKEHYSGLLQRARAAQVSSCQDYSGRQLMEYCCYTCRPGLHACHPEKPFAGCVRLCLDSA